MECYDISKEDFSGSGPLVWAARNGHEEVVKILLGREEVSPDKPDNKAEHRSHLPLIEDMREW